MSDKALSDVTLMAYIVSQGILEDSDALKG